MKTNVHVYWILSAFFFLASAGYTVWSLLDSFHEAVEWVGTLAMAMCGILFALVGFYLGRVYKAQGGELPEDRPDSTIDDGDSEVGFYSPWSWWPLMIGVGVGLVFLGLAIGLWIALIGGAFAILSIVGWTYEYYRGYFSR